MVAVTGSKSLLRTSVSILAMVLMSSAALADDETAVVDDLATVEIAVDQPVVDDGLVIDDEVTVGFGEEEVGQPIDDLVDPVDGGVVPVDLVDDGSVIDVTIDQVKRTDEVTDDLPIDDSGIMYMTGGGAVEKDPVTAPLVASQSRDAGRIPNLCDTAGPGWNWLCGGKAE